MPEDPKSSDWTLDEKKELCGLYIGRADKHSDPQFAENAKYLVQLTEIEADVSKSSPKPHKEPVPEPTNALVVTRFWNPGEYSDAKGRNLGAAVSFRKAAYAEGKLWFFSREWNAKREDVIGMVDLNTFKTQFEPIPSKLPRPSGESYGPDESSLQFTSTAVYLPDAQRIKKWNRKTGEWSVLDLPQYSYGAQVLGESLYLMFDLGTPTLGISNLSDTTSGGGIFRVGGSDKAELLVASRRRPAQTTLDAQPSYLPITMFGQPGKTLGAVVQSLATGELRIYRESGKDWQLILTIPNEDHDLVNFQAVDDVLFLHRSTRYTPTRLLELSLFRADRSSEKLLFNPLAAEAPQSTETRWDMPAELKHGKGRADWRIATDYFRESLYLLSARQEFYDNRASMRGLTLHIYKPGIRTPISVPLRFKFSARDNKSLLDAQLAHSGNDEVSETMRRYALSDIASVSSMIVTPEGVVLYAWGLPGFWFLSNAEIEKWTASNGAR